MPLVANVTTTAVRARNRPWSGRTVATKGSNRIDSMRSRVRDGPWPAQAATRETWPARPRSRALRRGPGSRVHSVVGVLRQPARHRRHPRPGARRGGRLGYAGPTPLAASLRRGRSGVIGVFIGERLLYAFRDPVSVQLLDGITEVLGTHGAGLLLLAGDSGRPPLEQILRMPLDAAVFATCGLEDDPALGRAAGPRRADRRRGGPGRRRRAAHRHR